MKTARFVSFILVPFFLSGAPAVFGAEPDNLEAKLDALLKEIRSLQQQLNDQKQAEDMGRPAFHAPASLSENIILSGEGAVAYFDTESKGGYPNNEFRVDEARLFLDVQMGESAYLFTELNLIQREDINSDVELGELYLDLEDLSRFWHEDYALTLRAGRFDIPFGEEYLHRDAVDDPLISHSLGDLWGIDEGLEVFGDAGPIDYVVAVQNGSVLSIHDGDSDKAVVARLGVHPTAQSRFSVSAMRTGDIDTHDDGVAELWFGNDYLRPIGAAETTEKFSAEVYQADARWSWAGGHVAASGGLLQYEDDDTAADNDRDATYYYFEGVQDVTAKLYAGARYSAIHSDDGIPVIGQGHYDPDVNQELTDDIWRLSLGLGYRWSAKLVLKTEYSFERGDATDGRDLDKRDQVSAQAAYGF